MSYGYVHADQYGRYANEVGSEQRRYENRLDSLQSSRRSIESRLDQTNRRYSEERQRLQHQLQSEVSNRDAFWSQQLASKQQQWEEKEAAIEKEMDAQIEQVRQKKEKVLRERQQAERQQQLRAYARPVSSTLPHQYKPSLSTGIYGGYMLKKFPENSMQKFREESFVRKLGKPAKMDSRAHHYHGHHQQHDDDDEKMEQEEETDVLYQQMYAEHKKVDEEYKLEFKPECNVIGCCNQPEVDPKLLKGDMYVCKAHRVEMVNQFKQSGIKGEMVDDVLDKFGSMSDAELLQHGEQMEADDYFLKGYTAAQHRRIRIAKKLSTLKRTSSEYWRLKLEYKHVQKRCDFLVMIRKISNPFSAVIADVVRKLREEERREGIRKQRERRQQQSKEKAEKSKKEIASIMKLVDEFQATVLDKKKMKNECIQKRKMAQNEYNDTKTHLKDQLKNADSKITTERTTWNKRINDKKKKHEQELTAEENRLNELIKKKEQDEDDQIKAAEDEGNKAIRDEENQWQEKRVSLGDAIKKLKDKYEAAKQGAPALDAETAELEKELEEEDMDEALWEKKMDRLEKLEEKKAKRTQMEKDIKDKEAELERELKKKQDEHDREMQRLKDQKKTRLDTLRKLKEENMKTWRDHKKDELKRVKDKCQADIRTMEQDKDREIDRLRAEKQNIQSKLNEHQTTGKRKLEQVKRESERKQRQYEREQKDAEKARERERNRALEEAKRERNRALEEAERERKRKEREAERERDDRDFERARNRASDLCDQHFGSKRVGVFVVWESGKNFKYEVSLYDLSVDWKYQQYGKFWVGKFVGTYKKDDINVVQFWTKGRYTYYYLYKNDYHQISKDKDGDTTHVRIWL